MFSLWETSSRLIPISVEVSASDRVRRLCLVASLSRFVILPPEFSGLCRLLGGRCGLSLCDLVFPSHGSGLGPDLVMPQSQLFNIAHGHEVERNAQLSSNCGKIP